MLHYIYETLIVTAGCVVWPIALACIAALFLNLQGVTRLEKKIYLVVFSIAITLFALGENAVCGVHWMFEDSFAWDTFALLSLVIGSFGIAFAGVLSMAITGVIHGLMTYEHPAAR